VRQSPPGHEAARKAATHFMEFVEAEREYRVHIFNGKSIRISEKGFTDDRKKDYITRKPTHDVRTVRQAAKRAVSAVGLDFGAVDILARGEANQEVFVLEVNSAPGLGGSMPELYARTFIKWKESQ
jgi:D-alanine-D-alanine ligase-like ATP-grasp enzyme